MGCYVFLPSESGGEDLGGFWTSNGVGESVRDFIFATAQRDFPEVYDRLMQGDLAEEWWPGKLLDLHEVLSAAGGLDEALKVFQPDSEIVTRIAADSTWEADLRTYLQWTAMVFTGEIEGTCQILPDYSALTEFPASDLVYGQTGIPDERLPLSAGLIRRTLEHLGRSQLTMSGFLSKLGPILQVGAQADRYVVVFKDAASRWLLVPSQAPLDSSEITVGARQSKFEGRFGVQNAEAFQAAWYFCIRASRDPKLQWQEFAATS